MSPTRISIDLAQSPLQVGGHVIGRIIVSEGEKGVSVVGPNLSPREKVVEALVDARNVVKAFFGAQNFDAAVVVVPNVTSFEHREKLSGYGRAAGYNITQVISENVAVSEAYVEKARPTSSTKLAIISISAGILDVTIVSVSPNTFILHDHKASPEPIDFEEHKSGGNSGGGILGAVGGLVGGAVHTLVVDPLEKVTDILKDIFNGLKTGSGNRVEKVVLVGKASKSEKVQHLVKEKFHGAEVWTDIENAVEIAAYGAASLSYKDQHARFESEQEIDPDSDVGVGGAISAEEEEAMRKGSELGQFHFGG